MKKIEIEFHILNIFVYLESIESDEDIGDYYRQMDQNSTQPGQTQDGQQDENWSRHSPANINRCAYMIYKCTYSMCMYHTQILSSMTMRSNRLQL